jgi:excisionase family DNA binding protein
MSNCVSRAKEPVTPGFAPSTTDELLDLYLSMPFGERDERFASTARAAEIAGVSQRTIQLWIELGAVGAVCIGKKYQVSLDSLREWLRSQTARRSL